MPNTGFDITELGLADAKLVRGPKFDDDRGYFAVTANDEAFEALGIGRRFTQDNQSFSHTAGTVRGLHYQLPPFAQAKLVRVLTGSIRDVIVDARIGSPTFGEHVSVTLSAESGQQVYVPRGFLHGFMTLEPDTMVLYKVDNAFAQGHDRSVQWNDPDLAIQWPEVGGSPTLSEKDRHAARWADLGEPFTYGETELDCAQR
ncbi:dTDP-4-dehydrorhamnose 3,5-epimerase [Maricaulis maris]|uniref:dTDP-4-dehydrorhamnose 3,5-epimerase n=1 Tax=Maricaulis maris TaxID=74318 RepID=UPI00291D0E23|nr:dTDP-4-dehydrorhamnose 3,5-epimerase [Maricaulis maris]